MVRTPSKNMTEQKNQKVNKKIAEIMSEYGHPLSNPVYSKNRTIEKVCLFLSKWTYRLTEGLYFKIKYFLQRHTRGYDELENRRLSGMVKK